MPGNELPRISGVLNNCSIGVVLPTLLRKIEAIANFVEQGNGVFDAQILAAYEEIKMAFCKYYGIDPNDFSFARFRDYLNAQTFLDFQMVMGPPMRSYIEQNAIESGEYDPDSCQFATIQKDNPTTEGTGGRYPGMAPGEAHDLLYRPLGIHAQFLITHPSVSAEVIAFEPPEPTSCRLDIYYQDGHYELQPHDKVPLTEPSNDKYMEIVVACGSPDPAKTLAALQDLRTMVRNELGALNVKLVDVQTQRPDPVIEPSSAPLSPELVVAPAVPPVMDEVSGSAGPAARVSAPEERAPVSAKDHAIEQLASGVQPDHREQYKALVTNLIQSHKDGLFKPKATDTDDEKLAKELQSEEIERFTRGGFRP